LQSIIQIYVTARIFVGGNIEVDEKELACIVVSNQRYTELEGAACSDI
jgi:hypothetical protein